MQPAPSLTAIAIPGIPLIQAGDDIVSILLQCAAAAKLSLEPGDVIVIASKIIAKAEGRSIALADVTISAEARAIAHVTAKDPRLVELALQESRRVSRKRRGVLVTEHRLGFVSANAGIDQSNIEAGDESALLLPLDPDHSAARIRKEIAARLGYPLAVVITDTHGRPFRVGNVGVAIGLAGLPALKDLRGCRDLYGRELQITQTATADMVASAAHLLTGEGAEGLPVVLLRGLALDGLPGQAIDLIRAPEHDLYR